MRHVFLFSAYNNIKNMYETIQLMSGEHSEFIIHIDAKVDISVYEEIALLEQQPNVHIIKERIKVQWGGFSHVRVLIDLMRRAVEKDSTGYVHLLSDSCFPVKTAQEIYDFIEQNKGKEYIDYEVLPSKDWPYGGVNRVEYYHMHDLTNLKKSHFLWKLNEKLMLVQKHLGLKRKNYLNWWPYYGGSTWWTLSGDAVKYCVDLIDSSPKFEKQFSHTFCFEESCIQTIIMNSKFKDKVQNKNLRHIDWNNRHGNMPANLDETDYEKLTNTECLFARKFVSPYSDMLKEQLKSYLSAKMSRTS